MPDDFPVSGISPDDSVPELRCVAALPVVRYFEHLYGQDKTHRIVGETRMRVEYLKDTNNWVSLGYFYRLLAKLVEVTGDPNAPYTAAVKHTDHSSYRALGFFVTHVASLRECYRMLPRFSRLWTKTAEWSVSDLTRNACRISIELPHHAADRNNCLAIAGSLAAVPVGFGLPVATVHEEACACDGSAACVYRLKWVDRPKRLWGSWGLVAAFFMSAAIGSLAGWTILTTAIAVLLAVSGYSVGRQFDYMVRLKETYRKTEDQADSLLESLRETAQLAEDLQERVEERTQELSRANEALERALEEVTESQVKVLVTEKQAAVGVLAAGMAHEINNPINAIGISIQGLREDVNNGGDLGPLVDTASRALDRCKRIVSELLAFSREPTRMSRVDLADVLHDCLSTFERECPATIQVIKRIPRDLPNVRVDGAQIRQALANLLANAVDAMRGRGMIETRLGRNGSQMVILVKDNGPGIGESLRGKIFDPFFSTKPPGEGTGLGLSIAYQLVRRNGGTLDVECPREGGAVFSIRFPLRNPQHEDGARSPKRTGTWREEAGSEETGVGIPENEV